MRRKQLAAAPAAVLSILYTRTYAIWMNEKHPRESEVIKNIHLLRQMVGQKFKTFMSKEELSPEQIKLARAYITQVADPKAQGDCYEKLQYKVPYFNQRDSEAYPEIGGGMCNLSSMAMGLCLFGVSNPHKDMQYDDALEKIRRDQGMRDREKSGQMDIANHFGYYFGGIEGSSKQYIDNTYVGELHQADYKWWSKNVIPELRRGNAITLGIKDKTNSSHGHIVHLLGVRSEGLYIHDPYGKINFSTSTYISGWSKNDKADPMRGKSNFLEFCKFKKMQDI
ncbi:MAG: hypothetical protein HC880_10420 [Bacteroidia bacterium]|nr:hypothetical protein [Bacteroidia bacterium]